jgi:hypothetical protein
MSQNNSKIYAALAIACLALVLSLHTAMRGPSEAKAPGAGACVDQVARDQVDKLRGALAERDAIIARLARAANAPSGATAAPEPPPSPATPPEPGPRRYVHFEIPSPAVSVTQKDDGTFDIRTTDPTLAGSVIQVTAFTQAGGEDKLLMRIP